MKVHHHTQNVSNVNQYDAYRETEVLGISEATALQLLIDASSPRSNKEWTQRE
jgi:hypothetical protein